MANYARIQLRPDEKLFAFELLTEKSNAIDPSDFTEKTNFVPKCRIGLLSAFNG